jgi:hypothetical protein
MKWILGILLALIGAAVGAQVGLAVADSYIFRAEDGTRLPGCGNVGMEPGMLIGLVLGVTAGVWLGRRADNPPRLS